MYGDSANIKENKYKNCLLEKEYEYFVNLKDKSNSLFYDIIKRFTNINTMIDDFFLSMKPFIEYFYSVDEGDKNTFVNSVLKGYTQDIIISIETIIKYLNNDRIIDRNVEEDIKKILELNKSVSMILDTVETIDLYAKNTMLISIKSGEEGSTLTTIAKEMTFLSKSVGEITENINDVIGRLNAHRQKFLDTVGEVDLLVENYLTQMTLKVNSTLDDMVKRHGQLSVKVRAIEEFSKQLKENIKNVIVSVQIQDVVRQDIEKILYAIDVICEDKNGLQPDIFLWCIIKKLSSFRDTVSILCTNTSRSIIQLQSSIDQVMSDFKSININDDNGQNFNFITFFDLLNNLRVETVDYINKILILKEELKGIVADVLKELNKISDFFIPVKSIIKKYDVINMLTRIELARHRELQKTIASSLSDISNIPRRIKDVIEEAEKIYYNIINDIEEASLKYTDAMNIQNRLLRNCLNNLVKINSALEESQNRYLSINSEVFKGINVLKNFLDEKFDEIIELKLIEEQIETFYNRLMQYEKDYEVKDVQVIEKVMNEVTKIYGNDYKGMMLISLLKEYTTSKTQDSFIVF